MGGANICRPDCRVGRNSRFYFRAIWKKQIYCERTDLLAPSSYRIIRQFLLKSSTTLTGLCNGSGFCLLPSHPLSSPARVQTQHLPWAHEAQPSQERERERVATCVPTVHRSQGVHGRGKCKRTAAALPERDSCGVVLKVSFNRQKYTWKLILKTGEKTSVKI